MEDNNEIRDWRGWVIGALFTVLILLSGAYTNTISGTLEALQKNQAVVQENTRTLSERVTTLEESKRNTELYLVEIKSDLKEVKELLREHK